MFSQVDDGGDLGQGESGGLGVANEPKSVNAGFAIGPIPVRGAVGLGEDSDGLVVADGLGGHSGFPGELADSHAAHYRHLTFQSTRRCITVAEPEL